MKKTIFFLFIVTLLSAGAEIIEVSGSQNGVWDAEDGYQVVGDITVEQGDTLIIEPGVIIQFMGDFTMMVNGILLAEGTVTDSILFTSGQPEPAPFDWEKIELSGFQSSGSRLAFCIIEYSHRGLKCSDNTYPLLLDNSMRYNQTCLTIDNAAPTIERCNFLNSEGGMNISNGLAHNFIRNNIFEGNQNGINCDGYSYSVIESNLFRNNSSCGIVLSGSGMEVIDNIIINSETGIWSFASGAYVSRNIVSNCIYGVSFESYGDYGLELSKNTIYNCDVGIRDIGFGFDSYIILRNNIFYEIETVFNGENLNYYMFSNNLFWQYDNLTIEPGLENLGSLSTTNANGDTCDIYNNIFLDPLCQDPLSNNFELMQNSPAINAGIFHYSYNDPDGTIADIGACYYQLAPEIPVADFQAAELFGAPPFPVNFFSNSTGEITDFLWDFGDGNTSDEEDPLHIYENNGIYNVSLTISGPAGSNTRCRNEYIEILPQVEIFGYQSGTWSSDNTYLITGDSQVLFSDTLIIEPGTKIRFMGKYSLSVDGILLAVGSENDSVRFTSASPYPAKGDWEGITLGGEQASQSLIDHCVIEYAETGIYLIDTDPPISHSRISHCGYAIDGHNTSAIISENFISDSELEAVMLHHEGSATVINNTFTRNHTSIFLWEYPTPLITENLFVDHTGWCIRSQYTTAMISYNVFENFSRGVRCYAGNPVVHHNSFNNGSSRAISVDNHATAIIYNNTICNCRTGILFDDNVESTLVLNNLFYGNETALDAEIQIENVEHNLFYLNVFDYADCVPVWFGAINSTNYNNDPCDINYNLFMSPRMIDPELFDYNLPENSPCIDAGNPDPVYNDPDCTISDIGAFYYQLIIDNNADDIPASGITLTNYPNPFNPSTTIEFYIPQSEKSTLKIYNIRGELVTTLLSENLPAGKHTITWDGRDDNDKITASSIYFYRLETEDREITKRMLLLK